jgi:molybdopterin-guanine dinucleotide biosynthesis protein A
MREPLGVVLAGGLGTRMGGRKALAVLDGRPLVAHVLQALAAVTAEQVVVAKRDTALPPGLTVWVEPDAPRHPLAGVRHALREAGGAPVLCCGVDLPRLDPATLRALVDGAGPAGAVARAGGFLHPTVALWTPAALPVLEAFAPDEPARAVAERAGLVPVDVDPAALVNVNRPEDLRALG